MNYRTPTAGEKAMMKDIAKLMARTLALSAQHPDMLQANITEANRLENPRVINCEVSAHRADWPLLLGGGGTYFKNVRELGAIACPSGCYINVSLATDETQRQPSVAIPRRAELSREMRDELLLMLSKWHMLLNGGMRPPPTRCESTATADVFIITGRDLPKSAMGALRRIIGWAAICNGRMGFLEWEQTQS